MQQFEWLRERLAHDSLDRTIILAFSRVGSWMGLRVQELFQLSGDGSFLWEWEDAYARISYQKQTSVLDKQATSQLFHLFQTGLPSLLPVHQGQPLPPLPPDTIPAYFSIAVGDQQATYMYQSEKQPQLKHLLDQFVLLRKQQRIV